MHRFTSAQSAPSVRRTDRDNDVSTGSKYSKKLCILWKTKSLACSHHMFDLESNVPGSFEVYMYSVTVSHTCRNCLGLVWNKSLTATQIKSGAGTEVKGCKIIGSSYGGRQQTKRTDGLRSGQTAAQSWKSGRNTSLQNPTR